MTERDFTAAAERYLGMVYRLALNCLRVPADAEDAVQEAFLRLLTASPRFRDAQHEKAWLIRTTLHRAADIQRAAARKNVPLEEATGVQTEESGLLAAVRSLPEKYSAVLYLHYYEGYSIKEIAKLLGVPAPTVGTRLARGRERLRRLIKEEIS